MEFDCLLAAGLWLSDPIFRLLSIEPEIASPPLGVRKDTFGADLSPETEFNVCEPIP